MNRPRSPKERAAALGWTVHERLVEPPADTGRSVLLGEVFGLLVELDDRSLQTWASALRSRGGR